MKTIQSILCRVALLGLAAAGFLHCWTAVADESDAPLNVVLLYSGDFFIPAAVTQDRAMRDAFTAGTKRSVNFYIETLHANNLSAIDFDADFTGFLRRKYQGQKIDLIVSIATPALNFLERNRSELWPEAPAMFFSVDETGNANRKFPPGMTGLTIKLDPAATLDFALQLLPKTLRVVVVTGASESDHFWLPDIQSHLQSHHQALGATYLTNQTVAELATELSRLPVDAVVLYTTMFTDASRKRYVPRDVVARLSAASTAPIFGLYETMLDHGIVGGVIPSLEEHGRRAGELGLRIIAGEKPESIPVPAAAAGIPIVDWRQLRRWSISESRLPSGSVVRFRPTTLWDDYKNYVIGGLCIILAQAATIAALLTHRARRRRAEAAVRESEERMALAADAASLGMWVWDIPRNQIWMSDRGKQLFGYEPGEEVSYDMIRARVHPEDATIREEAIQQALAGTGRYHPKYRLLLPGGSVRWVASAGRIERDAAGKATRLLGVVIDITAHTRAELEVQLQREELAHLSRVTMLGELSGSLAHELNQPLTAILSNAQAAQRFLASDDADLSEVRAILADIVSEDKRAGEVIHRLRLLLKKGEVQRQPLDLNEVVLEVLKLVRSDLVNSGISAQTELTRALPAIRETLNKARVFKSQFVMMGKRSLSGGDLRLATGGRASVLGWWRH